MADVRTHPTMCWSVAANPSPLGVKMHNAGYEAAGLDYTYVATGATTIAPVLDLVRRAGVRGLGVSMPHKQSVIHQLDAVTEAVSAIGACNTVVNSGGHLTGHNTDHIGAWRALEEAGLEGSRRAAVIGSGGVARAIIYALAKNGIDVDLIARNRPAAETLAEELGATFIGAPDASVSYGADLVVNATPVYEVGEWPLNLGQFPDGRGLLEVHFGALEPPLCVEATRRKWSVAPGWRMLLHQGAAQFELYTETEAPLGPMGDVLEAALAGSGP